MTLLLSHDPVAFSEVPGDVLLTLSGHTHGGQIVLPLIGPIVNASDAPMAWTHGHITKGSKNLIVSAGLGTSALPFRVNCPPEIVLVDLVPGPQHCDILANVKEALKRLG